MHRWIIALRILIATLALVATAGPTIAGNATQQHCVQLVHHRSPLERTDYLW